LIESRLALAGVPVCEAGEDFPLTLSLQSVKNGFTASIFQVCNFALLPCEHRRQEDQKHVPQDKTSVRPDRCFGFRSFDSPPDTEKFPRLAETVF
jgi:hypothetical protein